MEKDNKVVLIIDTKWKNIDQSQPSTHDLRQMYVYNEYWKSTKSLLLYPSNIVLEKIAQFDCFVSLPDRDEHHQCGLGRISVLNAVGKLYENIGTEILKLIE